jgi:hypothetical protein
MYVAVRYFGCPVDMQCALLLKPPKVVVVPATPADCPPDELVVEIERMAFAAVAVERLHVCADYLIAFQLMMFSRSRKEDFSTARGIRLRAAHGTTEPFGTTRKSCIRYTGVCVDGWFLVYPFPLVYAKCGS